jgi:hypothetical protein
MLSRLTGGRVDIAIALRPRHNANAILALEPFIHAVRMMSRVFVASLATPQFIPKMYSERFFAELRTRVSVE